MYISIELYKLCILTRYTVKTNRLLRYIKSVDRPALARKSKREHKTSIVFVFQFRLSLFPLLFIDANGGSGSPRGSCIPNFEKLKKDR